MKNEVIITAKTVEEAVEKAVAELGAPSVDAVETEVLEEPKKGLFGIGSSPAKVRVTYKTTGIALAEKFVRQLLDDMNMTGEVSVEQRDEDVYRIHVTGEDTAALIGHHGETLDAFQYLVNLAANRADDKKDHAKISVDVEGYRAKREEALRALARRMADKVLRYKKSVMLEPMNPYERRIIHSEVQLIAGVSTNSIGSDNNRKVVIFLEEENG